MNIDYVARNLELDTKIREFTADKLQKVGKFLDDPVEVRVTVEQEKHRCSADLHITHRFGIIQANEETDDIFDAVNLAVDKAEKQARRSRNKFRDKRRKADRNNGSHWPVEVVDEASVGLGTEPRIVESNVLSIKPMSLDEAAIQLEESDYGFVVFRNATNDQVNVLYRRKDKNYGLISPE
mgnify:FL=1|jgi:putative sigma-54 modulation protein